MMAKRQKKKKQAEEDTPMQYAQEEAESGRRVSGEPDSNLAAVGAGGISGAVAGAAIGTAIGGPVGGAIGAIAGGVAGGTAADQLQDRLDPKVEELYWQDSFRQQPYYIPGEPFDKYLPAYRLGWESAARDEYAGRSFEELEPQLREQWKGQQGSWSEWDQVREIVRAGFERIRSRA